MRRLLGRTPQLCSCSPFLCSFLLVVVVVVFSVVVFLVVGPVASFHPIGFATFDHHRRRRRRDFSFVWPFTRYLRRLISVGEMTELIYRQPLQFENHDPPDSKRLFPPVVFFSVRVAIRSSVC